VRVTVIQSGAHDDACAAQKIDHEMAYGDSTKIVWYSGIGEKIVAIQSAIQAQEQLVKSFTKQVDFLRETLHGLVEKVTLLDKKLKDKSSG